MDVNQIAKLQEQINYQFGLSWSIEKRHTPSGISIKIRPDGYMNNETFSILISVGWKRIQIEFIPDDMAGILLLKMGNANQENKHIFWLISRKIKEIGGSTDIKINGIDCNFENFSDWPQNWRNLSLRVTSQFYEVDDDLGKNTNLSEYIHFWVSIFLSMLLPLLPIKQNISDDQEDEVPGESEGYAERILMNHYERSQYNRQTCLLFNGFDCQVCGFNFETTYGLIGKQFIHVHHIIPLSQIDMNYKINPIKDLVPLCPNCHSMVHKKNPPFSIDELKEIFFQNQDK